jgi:hypothetical protein
MFVRQSLHKLSDLSLHSLEQLAHLLELISFSQSQLASRWQQPF